VNSHFVNHEEERFSEPLSPGSIEKKKVEHRVENATLKLTVSRQEGCCYVVGLMNIPNGTFCELFLGH